MKQKLLYLLLFTLGLTTFSACSDDDDDNVTPPVANVPEAVTNAFKTKYPDVNISQVKWEYKGNYIVAEYKTTANMKDVDAWFSKSGEWKMTETDFGKDLFLIPTELNVAFNKSDYALWTIDDISLYEYPDQTKDFYMFEVEKAGQQDMAVYFKTDGTLIKAAVDTDTEITPDTSI